MSEREWKTSSGSASPMPTSVPPMGASSNTFGAVGQAAGHVHPQGLYGVPPLQTPGFTSGSSDVIEELLKEMANSHSGAMRPPSTANGQPSAKASKDMARVAGLPAPPHPSKLPTSSSIFDNMLNGEDTLGDINGHLYQAGAQPWMTSSYMTPNGLQGDSTAPFPGSLANLLQPGQAFPSSSRFMT
ncbi:hypothetical protein WJX84_004484 [Apatococcus fuscideae]|uniref:Uncharacterized protein n=1 Tax=Apatococcus fuscideae TaxID=2026836 RepID=A0AAW1S178_9CHLO